MNGFNIGRYWDIGPQKTLYLPAPLLKKGSNEIIVFELHSLQTPTITLTDTPDLGEEEKGNILFVSHSD